MQLSARITSQYQQHEVQVRTDEVVKTLTVPVKPTGLGSAVNGGELLLLALATCCCNDIYREAAKRQITVSGIEVTVSGEFGAEGEPGRNFTYTATVKADASAEEVAALIQHVDKVAEVHNTLRQGLPIVLQP
ncbi:OsmC family protein [Hymenobacter pini]|uniref:OsmC family protein n=1 Tax=Hymenobacter pini TaxID=2880879 RepID=UPI001CF4637B|nr:OsmC family protein [Hymenobacter pini]MCA8831388.1 OsmC family protein [Hymenobacter pini]